MAEAAGQAGEPSHRDEVIIERVPRIFPLRFAQNERRYHTF
jgi:hypothetical protein